MQIQPRQPGKPSVSASFRPSPAYRLAASTSPQTPPQLRRLRGTTSAI